jgi:hypothetical protein
MKSTVLLISLAALLTACGGGGGGGSSTPTTSYTCNETTALASVENIVPGPTITWYANGQVVTFETWTMNIEGVSHNISVRIAMPPAGVPPRGLWLYSHGMANFSALPKEQLDNDGYREQVGTDAGYIAVSVARRGNFGSTGTSGSPNYFTWLAEYQSRQISYSQLFDRMWGYQAETPVAALEYMKTDARFAPYLNNIVLTGFSGGAETLMYVAAKSSVFKSATKKAMLRGAGRDSGYDSNPEAVLGNNESMSNLSAVTSMTPSYWYVGSIDPITSPTRLACAHSFYNKANGAGSKLVFVTGAVHGGSEFYSPPFIASMKAHLQARGMPGF